MQLNLFVSPPPENPMTPSCFRDNQQYSEWLYFARNAKESCTICEDCLPEYQQKMKSEGRCHQEWYSVQVLMRGRTIPAHPDERKVTKEINHEKLYWEFFPSEEVGPDDESSSSGIDQANSTTAHGVNP
jgi:hypothetical protein